MGVFLYENSPKKCWELEGVIEELAQYLAPTDMPVRAFGDLCSSPHRYQLYLLIVIRD